MAAGSLRLPLSPAGADRIRWVSVVATLVAAVALLVAQGTGYAATLGVTLVLALAVAWGWPLLTGSWTPTATTVVLAVASVAIVLSALREDLLWVPAAVAFGIVLAFSGQLVRRTGREGLVLTLLSSFGGLVVIASGTSAVVAANSDRGRAVAVVAMAAVAAAVVTDLLVRRPGRRAVPRVRRRSRPRCSPRSSSRHAAPRSARSRRSGSVPPSARCRGRSAGSSRCSRRC